jgi:S-adenosyl-L-methionine hydrolase (adenosine-forming)
MAIITITTDFGTRDGYTGAMKGVILRLAPEAILVDVTHDIMPQDVRQAAMVVNTFAPFYPAGTIHVIVVDPGVGTDRALLAVQALDQIFLAPDNGLLSLIFDHDSKAIVRRIENRALFRTEVSRTFHGRDILAPVAAHLAHGGCFDELGPETSEYLRDLIPAPRISAGTTRGQIIYQDHFGNLVTNIRQEHLTGLDFASVRVRVGSGELQGIHGTYGEVEKGQPLCLIGSSGYLEIAVRERSAGEVLGVKVDTVVEVKYL